MIPDIFNTLSSYLNCTYSLALSRDGYWGTFDLLTEQWNGLIRDILDDIADLAVAPILRSECRSRVVDCLLPVDYHEDRFFVSRKAANSWTTFLQPFLYESWAVLMLMLVVMSLIFTFVVRMGKDKSLNEFTLGKCAIYVFGAYGGIVARRWSITPVNISAR